MDVGFWIPVIIVGALLVIAIIASIIDPEFFDDNDDFYFL